MREAFFMGGNRSGRLFATALHAENKGNTGVLFCHAFGGERGTTYRSTFLFSNALAERGIPSLRFDYLGTGDSDGSLEDVCLESMLEDTLVAADKAKVALGVERLCLLGIRFGAVIAARACSTLDAADDCIMWNPVISGASYFKELKRIERIIDMTARKGGAVPLIQPKDDSMTVIEADLMSPAMVEQLNSVDLMSEPLSMSNVFVTSCVDKKEQAGVAEFAESRRKDVLDLQYWLEQPREYWSSSSMYDAYFPTPTFEATLGWVDSVLKRS